MAFGSLNHILRNGFGLLHIEADFVSTNHIIEKKGYASGVRRSELFLFLSRLLPVVISSSVTTVGQPAILLL